MSEGEMMTARLHAFVESHPDGWNHEQWLGLLAELEGDGLEVSEHAEIGAELERTRLSWELERRGVPGLGPKRTQALAKRFGTLWRLRHASVDDVARVPSFNRALAERVIGALN
jgi:hypothetical protein